MQESPLSRHAPLSHANMRFPFPLQWCVCTPVRLVLTCAVAISHARLISLLLSIHKALPAQECPPRCYAYRSHANWRFPFPHAWCACTPLLVNRIRATTVSHARRFSPLNLFLISLILAFCVLPPRFTHCVPHRIHSTLTSPAVRCSHFLAAHFSTASPPLVFFFHSRCTSLTGQTIPCLGGVRGVWCVKHLLCIKVLHRDTIDPVGGHVGESGSDEHLV